jgi:hypothetical protein
LTATIGTPERQNHSRQREWQELTAFERAQNERLAFCGGHSQISATDKMLIKASQKLALLAGSTQASCVFAIVQHCSAGIPGNATTWTCFAFRLNRAIKTLSRLKELIDGQAESRINVRRCTAQASR